ncbi:MAG TPA: porin, partial [Pseudolabrys sp.]|nr:porin [Pseudolabrys sp.]
VQYVKICSLYGAGFYYIPGTDTCLKVGGWVRQYIGANANGNLTNGNLGSLNTNTLGSNNGWNWKARGYITADARTQTEFGTLRGYIAVGGSTQGQSGNSSFNSNRAFIQLAGFTFGVAQSFYDLYPAPALSYFGGMINPSSDTGDGGQTVSAYTAQFGNGFSATLSLEAPRTTTVFNAGTFGSLNATGAFWGPGSATGALAQSSGNVRYPDVVGNLRMDASWGAAQIMGGIHDVVPGYYGTATNLTTAATTATGNPAYATGWFIGAGAKINFPSIGPGDYFSFQVNYTQGALGYVNDGATTGAGVIAPPAAGGYYSAYNGGVGGNYGFGVITDGVYGAGAGLDTGVHLTTAWGVNAGYEHHWNKRWQSSLYGAYIAVSYDATANGNLCFSEGLAGVAGCDNNFAYWAAGTRTQFNIDSQTYVGLDVVYTTLDQRMAIPGTYASGQGQQPVAARTLSDQSAWMAEFRFHRNFYP